MRLKRLLLLLALIVFLILPGYGMAEDRQSFVLRFIPSEPLFSPPLADPLTPIPSLKYFMTNSHENMLGKIAAGATFGLIRLDYGPAAFQINAEGGIFSRADLYDRVVLEMVDYRIGFPLDITFSPSAPGWALQIFPYHTSSHLIDDFLFKGVEPSDGVQVQPPDSYSRDAIRTLVAYRFSSLNRLYGGISYTFDGIHWRDFINYHLGSELFSPTMTLLGHEIRLYLAEDLQAKEETDWNVNLNLQAGLSIGRQGEKHRLRIAIEYFAGNAVEGQFFEQKEQNIGIGASFDL